MLLFIFTQKLNSRTLRIFDVPQTNYAVSKAVEDSHISHQEYQLILKEVKHYRKMKEEIRAKSRKATDAITAEQREEILKQGREEGQQAFLAKIAATSATPTANAT